MRNNKRANSKGASANFVGEAKQDTAILTLLTAHCSLLTCIALCALAVLVLGGCSNQWAGDAATITIHLSRGADRAAYDEILEQLSFIVDFSGPSAVTVGPTDPGTRTINVSVSPGHYVITATALLNGEEYAKGSASAQARAGQPTPVTLILLYAGKYTVTFDSNGGSKVPPQQLTRGETVTPPETPTWFNHGFLYWCSDKALESEYDFNTPVTTDITLYAKWSDIFYEVKFVTNGGAPKAPLSIGYGGKVTRPADPTNRGYVFVGWYSNDNLTDIYDFNAPVTEDITLYAKWDAIIDMAVIEGVTVPVTGETPVRDIAETYQYTGTISWSPDHPTFEPSTVYTATITLTAETGYTLQGVKAYFFTVADAKSVSNAANSGLITAVFPSTAGTPADPTTIDIAAIKGVTVPVTGGTPVTSITETAQYTGTVSWAPNDSTFDFGTLYTATITLKEKSDFTLTGVTANFFTVEGATSVSNNANSGVVTAVFPPTATRISIADITGVTVPETGKPVSDNIETDQYTGTVAWSPKVSTSFASQTQYTADITLTAKEGFTFQGLEAGFFTVEEASSVTLVIKSANSGVVTADFPRTATTIGMANIAGVTPPKVGEISVTAITETTQYTGTVTWKTADGADHTGAFADYTIYTATITLTAKPGYTFQGVATNFFNVAGAASVSNSANSNVITATFPLIPYAPGGTGPGGGKVFYYSAAGFTVEGYGNEGDPGYFAAYTAHYLEAAPDDCGALAWMSASISVADISTGLGTGRKNTMLILAADPAAPAAKACKDLTAGGKNDWFLPSMDELDELYNNRFYVRNMKIGLYLCSSGASRYFQEVSGDPWRSVSESDVRAIRAF